MSFEGFSLDHFETANGSVPAVSPKSVPLTIDSELDFNVEKVVSANDPYFLETWFCDLSGEPPHLADYEKSQLMALDVGRLTSAEYAAKIKDSEQTALAYYKIKLLDFFGLKARAINRFKIVPTGVSDGIRKRGRKTKQHMVLQKSKFELNDTNHESFAFLLGVFLAKKSYSLTPQPRRKYTIESKHKPVIAKAAEALSNLGLSSEVSENGDGHDFSLETTDLELTWRLYHQTQGETSIPWEIFETEADLIAFLRGVFSVTFYQKKDKRYGGVGFASRAKFHPKFKKDLTRLLEQVDVFVKFSPEDRESMITITDHRSLKSLYERGIIDSDIRAEDVTTLASQLEQGTSRPGIREYLEMTELAAKSPTMNIDQLAAAVGVQPATVESWIKADDLPRQYAYYVQDREDQKQDREWVFKQRLRQFKDDFNNRLIPTGLTELRALLASLHLLKKDLFFADWLDWQHKSELEEVRIEIEKNINRHQSQVEMIDLAQKIAREGASRELVSATLKQVDQLLKENRAEVVPELFFQMKSIRARLHQIFSKWDKLDQKGVFEVKRSLQGRESALFRWQNGQLFFYPQAGLSEMGQADWSQVDIEIDNLSLPNWLYALFESTIGLTSSVNQWTKQDLCDPHILENFLKEFFKEDPGVVVIPASA